MNMHMKHVSFSERRLMVISDFEHHLMVLIVLPKLAKYNGVCVIGRSVNEYEIEIKNGLRFTCFNRTLNDAMANESILDMQGITEALSRYYFAHHESFAGIHPSPEYADLFCRLTEEATGYYGNGSAGVSNEP